MEELVEAHHIAKNTLGHTEFTLMQKILWTLWERCEERKLLTTREGYLALGPRSTQSGDTIAILLGCQVPVVVRQHTFRCEFVGTCYLNGIMQGEALVGLETGECEVQWFDIRPAHSSHETSQIFEFHLVGQRKGLNHRISSSSLPRLWVAVAMLSRCQEEIYISFAQSYPHFHTMFQLQCKDEIRSKNCFFFSLTHDRISHKRHCVAAWWRQFSLLFGV
jgi:hypothetical protein